MPRTPEKIPAAVGAGVARPARLAALGALARPDSRDADFDRLVRLAARLFGEARIVLPLA